MGNFTHNDKYYTNSDKRDNIILIEHTGISDKPIQTIIIVERVICDSEIIFPPIEQKGFEITKRIFVTSETFNTIKNILKESIFEGNNFKEHDLDQFGSFMFTIIGYNNSKIKSNFNRKSSINIINEIINAVKNKNANNKLIPELETTKKRIDF